MKGREKCYAQERYEPFLSNERILRKTTVEVVERSFTTQPKTYIKRGCHTIRERSQKYIRILKDKFNIDLQIPLERAKQIFQDEMDIWDRASLRAYFGTQPSISRRFIRRIATYATGTVSSKTIELTQQIPERKGYLESLGLVKFEKRSNTWFMILTNEALVPKVWRNSVQQYEGRKSRVSIDNFSLTPIVQGKERETVLDAVSTNVETVKNKQTTTLVGCERNRLSESIRLTPREKLVLKEASHQNE